MNDQKSQNRIMRIRTVGGEVDLKCKQHVTVGDIISTIANNPYILCPVPGGGTEILWTDGIIGIHPMEFTDADAESLQYVNREEEESEENYMNDDEPTGTLQ